MHLETKTKPSSVPDDSSLAKLLPIACVGSRHLLGVAFDILVGSLASRVRVDLALLIMRLLTASKEHSDEVINA
jgi:hypothetical protein